MKTRLTHVRANVSDLYKSIEWYENDDELWDQLKDRVIVVEAIETMP